MPKLYSVYIKLAHNVVCFNNAILYTIQDNSVTFYFFTEVPDKYKSCFPSCLGPCSCNTK